MDEAFEPPLPFEGELPKQYLPAVSMPDWEILNLWIDDHSIRLTVDGEWLQIGGDSPPIQGFGIFQVDGEQVQCETQNNNMEEWLTQPWELAQDLHNLFRIDVSEERVTLYGGTETGERIRLIFEPGLIHWHSSAKAI